MKNKLRSLSLAMIMATTATISAQKVVVSPVPHKVVWGEKAFNKGASFNLVGSDNADLQSVNLLKSKCSISNSGIQLVIGEKGDASVSDYADKIPSTAEGYYLSVTNNKIVIAGTDEVGTYYGVKTFLQIASQPEVMSVTITDYPQIVDRGIVEGFYGNPYSQNDRLRLFDFMGDNKMNVYVYGPKDDPYHKSKWRQDYPAAEAALMIDLINRAKANHVKFVWAVHPGGDIKWNKTDSLNVVKKFESMYKLGVRSFCVFFDDIGGEGAKAEKQAGLLNYLQTEFVEKHNDVTPMLMCPTGYSGNGGEYMLTLGKNMDKKINILWTGNSIVDMINKSDVDMIAPRMQRNPYIWLNYPVNDYCIDHMLMGPTYGNDLNIDTKVSGFTSNPMEYCEASKVSLYSLADYNWNLTDYDSNASWERAIKYLMPENANAFHVFCENNVDLGTTYHGLRRANESPRFTAAKTIFESAIKKGYSETAVEAMRQPFTEMINSANELMTSTSQPEMIEEITPWCKVMKCVAEKGSLIMDMYKSLNAENPELFVEQYLKYDSINAAQKKIRSRDFSGSIKNPNPAVATTFIVPFLNTQLQALIAEYKSKFDYRTDIFPKTQLDGKYFIKYNGKYLTDPNEIQNGIAAKFMVRDDVKPMRQEWTINIDAETGRFKIVNNQANRYLNENGKFAADPNGANKYESVWHTYSILRWANGKYSIENGGSAGNKYWGVSSDGTAIQISSNSTMSPSSFLFEIVPVEGGDQEPKIDASTTYFIKSGSQYLTNNNVSQTGGTPTFKAYSGSVTKAQSWKFSVDATTNRYKLVSAADDRYIKENGAFGTNTYFSSWNSYNILELGGAFSIQNAGDAGTSYWKVSNSNIATGGISLADSYLFTIEPTTTSVGVDNVSSQAQTLFRNGNSLVIANPEAKIHSIRVTTIDGRCLSKSNKNSSVSLKGINKGLVLVSVHSALGTTNYKYFVD